MPNFKALHERIAPKSAGRLSQVDKENSIALSNKSVNGPATKGDVMDHLYCMTSLYLYLHHVSTLRDNRPHSLILGLLDGVKSAICSKKSDRKQSYLEGVKANRSSVIDGVRKAGPFTSSSSS